MIFHSSQKASSPRWLQLALITGSLALTSINTHALEFKSIGNEPAVLYDAPSQKGKKTFVVARGMPVEVILTYGEWTKIRDSAGDLSWIESRLLSSKRNVIVNIANAKIRATGEETGTIVFTADKGVLLEILDPISSGWIKVKHRDGLSGFIKATDVWGG